MQTKFHIVVAHQLGQAAAEERIHHLLQSLKKRYADEIGDLQERWNGNTCEFSLAIRGFSASGKVSVGPTRVDLAGAGPFAIRPFKAKIESRIRQQAQELLTEAGPSPDKTP